MSEEKRVKSYIKPDKEKADSMIRERLKNIKEEDDIVVTEAETDKVIETKSDKVDKPEETKTEAKSEAKEAEGKKAETKKTEAKKAESKKDADDSKKKVATKKVSKSAAVAVPKTAGWLDSKKAIIIAAIGLFLFFVFIQLKYLYDVWFDPDELDIYTVAFEMVKGKILYRDIPSQHMPFTYIYSTIFYLLGAHEAWLQRLYYYILFSFFWTMFFVRYRKYVNKWVFVLHPILFYTYMQVQDFSTQILSENLVAIGAEIFILEFIRFLKVRDIDLKGCILMSVGVMFTFGTTFVSIFPLFFVGLGVLLMEIKWRIEKKQARADWWKMMLKRYGRLFAIVAIPWVIYLIFAIATNSLKAFYNDAYLINRLYYPKYNDGTGGSIGGTFLAPFMTLANEIFGINAAAIEPTFVLRWIGIIAGAIYFPYKLARKHGWVSGLTVFLFAMSFGLRGLFNYHGKGFVAVVSLLTMIVLVEYAYGNKESFEKANVVRKAFLATTVVLIFANNAYNMNNMFTVFVNSEFNHYQYDTDYMRLITDEDERIWQTNMCDAIPWASKRVTTGPSVSCPWMWEGAGAPIFEEYTKNPARVILFQLGYESWGNKMADYAPDAYYYIVNNYKYLPDSGQIWVLNSYYEEACRKVGIDPDTVVNDNGLSVTPYEVDPSEMPGMTKEDREEAVRKAQEAAEKGETEEEDKEEEEEKEEVTTEEKTEATTEATTEEEVDEGPIIVEPEDNDTNDVNDDTSSSVETTDYGPTTTTTTSGNGPGDVTVSPADEMGGSSNTVTQDTPGAVQAPDGSWVIQDDSDGPGQ